MTIKNIMNLTMNPRLHKIEVWADDELVSTIIFKGYYRDLPEDLKALKLTYFDLSENIKNNKKAVFAFAVNAEDVAEVNRSLLTY